MTRHANRSLLIFGALVLLFASRAAAQSPAPVEAPLFDDRPAPAADRAATPITPPDSSSAPSANRPAASRGGSSFWTTLGSLVLVAGMILVLAKLWKKHAPASLSGLPNDAVEVLGKRFLDQRQSICLVRIGSRVLVLGSSSEGLRALAEVTDPVEVDSLCGACRQEGRDTRAAETLRSLFRKDPARSRAAEESSAPAGFHPTVSDASLTPQRPEAVHV